MYYYMGYPLRRIEKELLIYSRNIYRWLDEFGLEADRKGVDMPREEKLRELYHGDGRTQNELAEHLGVCTVTVQEYLDKYGIESKTQGGSRD